MKVEEEFNKYDDEIIDIDEVINTDLKINPDYYIHLDLVNLSRVLTNPDVKAGFIQFRTIANLLESKVRASGQLGEDYEEKLKKFQEREEYKTAENQLAKETKLAFYMVELLTEVIFNAKTSTTNLKY